MYNIYSPVFAYLTDLVTGDPVRKTHPVVLMGKLINILEKKLNKNGTSRSKKIFGFILVLIVCSTILFLTISLQKVAYFVHPILFFIVNIWFISTSIAGRDLHRAAKEIAELLKKNDLKKAREKTAMVVARDTNNLSLEDITRATVETVAENTSDGVIAPLFYSFILGMPGAMLYKGINTMDSMLGYKNKRFIDFGWAAAKLDDIANYLPARITAIMILFTGLILRLDWKKGYVIMKRDAKKHPSPNSGFPESTIAGILGIRLGGQNYYHGKPSFRSYLGDKKRDFVIKDIAMTIRFMYISSASLVLIYFLIVSIKYLLLT